MKSNTASREKESHRVASRLAHQLPSSQDEESTSVDREDKEERKSQVDALKDGAPEAPAVSKEKPFRLSAGETVEDAQLNHNDAEETLREAGFQVDRKSQWGPSPTVATQYVDPKFAGTYHESSTMYDQFNLGIEEDKVRLNALMARAEPLTAPGFGRSKTDKDGKKIDLPLGIAAEIEKTEFSPDSGTFITMVAYREISYKHLVELL